MRKILLAIGIIAIALLSGNQPQSTSKSEEVLSVETQKNYWFELHRQFNKEYLYFGESGNKEKSDLIRVFDVKTGVPGKKPTPLHDLLGQEYWLITSKRESIENPETAPYFLPLNIPTTDKEPYGPVPYEECDGQCNWELPGEFGLHGVGGDSTKLSVENEGSSGCIRHLDEDITYLYHLLDPTEQEIRYYIRDN